VAGACERGNNPSHSSKDEECAVWQNICISVTLVIEMPVRELKE
jgi:hypothetical protein